MADTRLIDSKIRSSESFAELTFRQRDLWHGLIETVDDQGRMPGKVTFIRSTVWKYDDIPLADVQSDIDVLVNKGMIQFYEVDGRSYLQIINWWKYQGGSSWMAPSDFPPPDGWIDRCRYHGKGKDNIILVNWEKQGGFNNQDIRLPSGLPSGLPTKLPSSDGDVNDDSDGDVNSDVDSEAEISGNGHVLEISAVWNEITRKDSQPKEWDPLIAIGATGEDLRTALSELSSKGLNMPRSPDKCLPSVNLVVSKRKAKNNSSDYTRYLSGKFANAIQH